MCLRCRCQLLTDFAGAHAAAEGSACKSRRDGLLNFIFVSLNFNTSSAEHSLASTPLHRACRFDILKPYKPPLPPPPTPPKNGTHLLKMPMPQPIAMPVSAEVMVFSTIFATSSFSGCVCMYYICVCVCTDVSVHMCMQSYVNVFSEIFVTSLFRGCLCMCIHTCICMHQCICMCTLQTLHQRRGLLHNW